MTKAAKAKRTKRGQFETAVKRIIPALFNYRECASGRPPFLEFGVGPTSSDLAVVSLRQMIELAECLGTEDIQIYRLLGADTEPDTLHVVAYGVFFGRGEK